MRRALRGGEHFAQPGQLFGERARLRAPRQDRALALVAAAGDRAAAADLFAFERDDRIAEIAPAHELDADVELSTISTRPTRKATMPS